MTITSPPIVIKLRSADYNSDVAVEELVHQDSYEKLKEHIKADLEVAEKNRKERAARAARKSDDGFAQETYPPGSGLVYFIDGTRGAGKTTFLKSAFNGLSGHDPINKEQYGIKGLCRLAYIDPSRLEDAEIVLLGVLRAIKDLLDKRKSCICQDDEQKHNGIRDAFKKLAGGLSLFQKDHHQLSTLDPELFLDQGLKRTAHSQDLRHHFHDLLDKTCEFLKVDALLLAFDDADTNARHAIRVLECIRSYLDTPRLVILVTGDMELYSLQVRGSFCNSLEYCKHDQASGRTQQQHRMLDHLEEQYLLKLFPLQRRLQLRSLGDLIRNGKAYVLEYDKWDGEEKADKEIKRDIESVLNELIRRALRVQGDADIRLFRNYIVQQPLRSVMQILSGCAGSLSSSDEVGDATSEWSNKLSSVLRESLRGIAYGSLYRHDLDIEGIARNNINKLFVESPSIVIRQKLSAGVEQR